eukprot:Hpha_TRINITY_DN16828_c3_g1::TRINITY_DN16828_c3_g1_i1::g.148819::m.148819
MDSLSFSTGTCRSQVACISSLLSSPLPSLSTHFISCSSSMLSTPAAATMIPPATMHPRYSLSPTFIPVGWRPLLSLRVTPAVSQFTSFAIESGPRSGVNAPPANATAVLGPSPRAASVIPPDTSNTGDAVGWMEGCRVGCAEGAVVVGALDGLVGAVEGYTVGCVVGSAGETVGARVGEPGGGLVGEMRDAEGESVRGTMGANVCLGLVVVGEVVPIIGEVVPVKGDCVGDAMGDTVGAEVRGIIVGGGGGDTTGVDVADGASDVGDAVGDKVVGDFVGVAVVGDEVGDGV